VASFYFPLDRSVFSVHSDISTSSTVCFHLSRLDINTTFRQQAQHNRSESTEQATVQMYKMCKRDRKKNDLGGLMQCHVTHSLLPDIRPLADTVHCGGIVII